MPVRSAVRITLNDFKFVLKSAVLKISAMFRAVADGWNLFWWGNGTYPNRTNTLDDVYLRFYNGKKFHQYIDIRLSRSTELLRRPHFKKDKPLVLYIHGFKEVPLQESIQVVVSAYLDAQPDTNVVLLDWSNMAFGAYLFNAAPNTKTIAAAMAKEIKRLVDEKLDPSLIHIVGHSLGGQIAGFIGKNLQEMNITLNRITALDPAFPAFYPRVIMGHIEATDAKFVDIIHTDAGGYGAPVRTGTVDFWPNGGKAKQPGCPRFTPIPLSDEDLCSHWRSWHFWAESVRKPTAFPSAKADSYREFKRFNRNEKRRGTVYMGVNCDESATGNYYLTTNCCAPFGRGEDGLYFDKKKT